MIFVDSNVFMYAVGRSHALRPPAREFFLQSNLNGSSLFTSAEVLQEMVHAYLPVGRFETLDAALSLVARAGVKVSLVARAGVKVWPLEEEDVTLARKLYSLYPALDARDLCHLASCRRRGVRQVKTFDQALQGVLAAA